MSDRDWVGHPDFNPKGSRSNLHSQHKGAGRLQAQSATGRDSWNCQQQENLRDCRTQVIRPGFLELSTARKSQRLPNAGDLSQTACAGQALNESQAEGHRERERERGEEREAATSWRRRAHYLVHLGHHQLLHQVGRFRVTGFGFKVNGLLLHSFHIFRRSCHLPPALHHLSSSSLFSSSSSSSSSSSWSFVVLVEPTPKHPIPNRP